MAALAFMTTRISLVQNSIKGVFPNHRLQVPGFVGHNSTVPAAEQSKRQHRTITGGFPCVSPNTGYVMFQCFFCWSLKLHSGSLYENVGFLKEIELMLG